MKRFLFVVATTSVKAAGITVLSKTAGTLSAFLGGDLVYSCRIFGLLVLNFKTRDF